MYDNRSDGGESISLWLDLYDPIQDFVPYTDQDEFDWSAFEQKLPFYLAQSTGEFHYALAAEEDESYITYFNSRARFVLHDVAARQVDGPVPVSEPSTTVFILLGLLALMLRQWRSLQVRASPLQV